MNDINLNLLLKNLHEKVEFWRKKKDDSHQINNAVYCALAEIESAVRKSTWQAKKLKKNEIQ